jgi:hypothetical protein
LLCSDCLCRQGKREYSTTGFILHAISLIKERPEAWFLYLRHFESRGDWQECYTLSSLAEDICNFELQNLISNVYSGKYAIQFIKAKSAYKIGKSIEARDILQNLMETQFDSMTESYKVWISEEFKARGGKLKTINKANFSEFKLRSIPSIHIITLKSTPERTKRALKHLEEYGITPRIHYGIKFESNTDIELDKYLLPAQIGCSISHLDCIKNWYETTNEPFAIFAEDDVSLETIEYWKFTWVEFFANLPKNWECIQLCQLSENPNRSIGFGKRLLHDWGTQAYMITREYARKLIDAHIKTKYILRIPEMEHLTPVTEHVIFDGKSQEVYNFPLFVEDVEYTHPSASTHQKVGNTNYESHVRVMNWWKSKQPTIGEIFN